MEKNEFIFEIDVVSTEILLEEINRYNQFHNTDFQIIKIHEEIELDFCTIKTTASITDVFNLGFGLGSHIQDLRQKGEIDW